MLRDFTIDDLDTAINLGVDEWGHYSGLPMDVVNLIADTAIKEFLDRATYAKIYEEDGRAVGLIFGAIEGDRPLFPNLERTPYGSLPEEAVSGMLLEGTTDEELLESCKDRGYDCELVYFIASREMRGKGIGTKLIESYMDYLRSRGKRRMYLYTDDFSRYQFYERKGFVRDGCKTIFIDGGDHEYYIYSKELRIDK